MTTTPTSGAADLPDALIHAGMQALLQCTASELENLSPTLFEGYADDVQRVFVAMAGKALSATLAAGQAPAAPAKPAAQQGVAYAALPTSDYAGRVYEEGFLIGTPGPLYTADQMRAFADATHALRTSHGQAPVDAKALAEADRRAGEAERLLATCKEDVMRFEQVRSRMKYQWGADQRVLFDEIWDEALALKKAAQTDSVQEDAARYRWLREGNDAKHGAAWHVAVNLYGCEGDAAIDAARKQGENHDR